MYLTENLKYLRIKKKLTQEALSKDLNTNRVNIAKWETGTMPQKDTIVNLAKYFNISEATLMFEDVSTYDYMQKGTYKEESVVNEDPVPYQTSRPTGAQISKQKAFGDTEDTGLIYVPIAAQAGYSKNFQDPVYIDHLERLFVPGLPYKGDAYRYFEVEGDSMYPTLEEGMQVIGQIIPSEYWQDISNFYIHVIVKDTQILIKRLFKKDANTLVMISDNEEMYPQEKVNIEDVKELWLVKRKLDWRMTPPKHFNITV
jgi:phage repressor protein C with HTH and peptisase S24 domain